jgi:hypothetical protein
MNMSESWRLTAPKPEKLPPPLERKSQAAVVDWARWASGQHPELRFLFAVPNGDKRSAVTASLLVSQGVKPGVPDLILPIARGGHIGLAIEMKRKPNMPSQVQREWLNALQGFGWRALVCYGATEAIHALETYIKAPKTIAVPEYVRDIPF